MTSFVVSPGTVSCFCPNSGTQKEWMTSSDLRRSSTLRPTGRRRSPEVRSAWPGYAKLQANCCAVTSTCNGFEPALPFFASTIALTIAIATTSTVGIAVQVISSPVWPWIGGPSDSSSGAARNFQIEYAITAATTAKIATQITVTNQKTKSIRPASRAAGCGSQPGTSASVVAAPPATREKRTTCTTDPRRTADEPTRRQEGLARRTADCDAAVTSRTQIAPFFVFLTTPCTKRVQGTEPRRF